MSKKFGSIDKYLAGLEDDKRAVLQGLRETIEIAAPDAEECISYKMPAFRYRKILVVFGAAYNHCVLHMMSAAVIESFKDELRDFDCSKGAIHFTPDKPLPDDLVLRLIHARLLEM